MNINNIELGKSGLFFNSGLDWGAKRRKSALFHTERMKYLIGHIIA